MRTTLLIAAVFFTLIAAAQPTNNNCSSSSAITLTPVTAATSGNAFSCNTTGATQTYTPELCDNITSTHAYDVFFKFTAQQSSYIVYVDPSNGYDPAVFVYKGSCTGTLVGCSDDGGGNSFSEEVVLNGLIYGTTYYIRVYDYDNTSSPASFTSTFDIWVIAPAISGNASIAFNPNSLPFGNVQQNTSSTQTVDIENTGTSDLVIDIIDYPSSRFTGATSLPVIHPGDVFPLDVTFRPTSTGNFNGDIEVSSNASSSPDYISVSGTGTSTPSPQMHVSPNSLSFGSIQQGTTSAAQQIEITNPGNATLNVSSISTPTGYFGSWSGNITAGSSKTVNITFTPPAIGSYNGTITIYSNATNKNVTVTGGGIAGTPTTITGTVKDIEVLWSSNTVLNSGLNNCTVYLKTNGGTVITSTTTNSSGFFSLNATPGSTYYIEANISDSYGTFSVGKTNVSVGSNLEILIPRKITGQIETLLDNLEALKVYMDEYDEYRPVQGYNTVSAQNAVNGFDDFDNTFTKVKDNLTRLYLAERIIMSYYENAAMIGDEMATNFNAFLGIIGRLVSIVSKVRTLTQNHWALEVLFEPVQWLIDGCINLAQRAFKATSSALTGQAKQDYETLMDFEIDKMKYLIDANPENITNLLISPIKLAVIEITPSAINRIYVRPTQDALESAATQASYLNQTFNYTNTSAIHETKLEVYTVGAHSAQVKSEMANLYFANEIAQGINDVTDITSGVLALTGIGTAAIPVLQAVGDISSVIGYGAVGYSCVKGFREIKYLKTTVGLDVDAYAFYKTGEELSQLTSQQSFKANSALSDAIANYNAALQEILDDVDYSRESDAFQKLRNLNTLQEELNKAIDESINPILAASPIMLDSIPNFGDTYQLQFLNPLFDANSRKMGLYFDLIALMIDTTDYAINTEIVSKGNMVITANNTLETAITQFANLAIGISVLPYPAITDKTWNREMMPNTAQQLKISFKNYGSAPINNAYALISTTNGFTATNDSVYIGTIAAETEDSISYTITAPAFDTIGGFKWQLYSSNGYGLGTGGVLSTMQKFMIDNVSNLTATFAMSVLPIPADLNVKLEFNSPVAQEITLVLTDAFGKEISQDKFACVQGECFHTVSTAKLPSGVYLISAKGVQGISTSKIIVQH